MTRDVFADFNNMAPDGCVRLTTVGTIEDLRAQGISIKAGLVLQVGDGDLRATVVVRAPNGKEGWRGAIVDGPHARTDVE